MKKTTNNSDIAGFILINKEVGPSSFNVVTNLRKITGIKKIGHAGTLDPFASGLMIVAIGRKATRAISKYVKLNKEYVATLHLGAETDTFDREGLIFNNKEDLLDKDIDLKIIKDKLKDFVGKQLQTPPMFSAKKVNGKKLYELARKGIEIERKPVPITIHKIKFISYDKPIIKIKIKCSSGTYIRSIAYDFGRALGCGAYLENLERTKIGKFKIEDSSKIKDLDLENWKERLFTEKSNYLKNIFRKFIR